MRTLTLPRWRIRMQYGPIIAQAVFDRHGTAKLLNGKKFILFVNLPDQKGRAELYFDTVDNFQPQTKEHGEDLLLHLWKSQSLIAQPRLDTLGRMLHQVAFQQKWVKDTTAELERRISEALKPVLLPCIESTRSARERDASHGFQVLFKPGECHTVVVGVNQYGIAVTILHQTAPRDAVEHLIQQIETVKKIILQESVALGFADSEVRFQVEARPLPHLAIYTTDKHSRHPFADYHLITYQFKVAVRGLLS